MPIGREQETRVPGHRHDSGAWPTDGGRETLGRILVYRLNYRETVKNFKCRLGYHARTEVSARGVKGQDCRHCQRQGFSVTVPAGGERGGRRLLVRGTYWERASPQSGASGLEFGGEMVISDSRAGPGQQGSPPGQASSGDGQAIGDRRLEGGEAEEAGRSRCNLEELHL